MATRSTGMFTSPRNRFSTLATSLPTSIWPARTPGAAARCAVVVIGTPNRSACRRAPAISEQTDGGWRTGDTPSTVRTPTGDDCPQCAGSAPHRGALLPDLLLQDPLRVDRCVIVHEDRQPPHG